MPKTQLTGISLHKTYEKSFKLGKEENGLVVKSLQLFFSKKGKGKKGVILLPTVVKLAISIVKLFTFTWLQSMWSTETKDMLLPWHQASILQVMCKALNRI